MSDITHNGANSCRVLQPRYQKQCTLCCLLWNVFCIYLWD